MEGRKEYFLKNINDLLSVLEVNLRKNGKDHFFDLHTGAEDPICGLLNRIFGYELVNKNHEKMNFPGIDLADSKRRVAVQVTSDGDCNKVKDTLKVFDRPAIRQAFDRIIVVIMGRKPNYRTTFDSRGLELDIYAFDDLVPKIAALDTSKVEQIARQLDKAFVFRGGKPIPELRVEPIDEETLWDELPMIQEHYLLRFRSVFVSGNHRSLSLKDLYIPNPFALGTTSEQQDELMDLVEQFVCSRWNRWDVPKQEYVPHRVLLIEGQQCTGKSTLVANILNCAYFQWHMSPDQVHLLSFAERDLRSIELNVRNIASYLGLSSDKKLKDSLLIIDALDESDWSSQKASVQLECLMDSLMHYGCKLIITTRKNYINVENFQGILNITLLPFSLEHAEHWLDVYSTSDPSVDVVRMKENLRAVPDEVRRVVFLPHILQICITHNISLGSVVNLNQLYQLLFRGSDGLFLRDQYFPNPNAQHRHIQQIMGTMVQISIKCMQQGNRISTQELDAYIADSCTQMERVKTEYLLERCDGDCYAFTHKTIASYLIAQELYEAFSIPVDRLSDSQLLERIRPVVTADGVLSEDVLHSLAQMSQKSQPLPGDRAHHLLHQLLTDQLDSDVLKISGPYHQAAALYELWFDALNRLVFALKAAWRNEFGDYRFFETLSPAALERFTMFCNPSRSVNRSWDYLQHSMLDNWTLNELDLTRISMPSKQIRAMVMQGVKFRGCILPGSYLIDSDLSAACFDEAFCAATQFSNSLLCSASFRNAQLRGALFIDCDMSHVDLRGANLSKTKFYNCVLNGVKIDAQQLHDHLDLFNLETILQNNIKLYMDDCELPPNLVADEYRRQRPATHYIHYSKEVFSGGNIKKAELVRRTIANYPGSITTAQIMEACPRVSRTTIHSIIRNLLQSKEITKIGGGRHTAYIWNK